MGFKSWSEQLEKHKVLLVIVIVAFFIVEFQVFVLATMRSGHQSYMQVLGLMDHTNAQIRVVKKFLYAIKLQKKFRKAFVAANRNFFENFACFAVDINKPQAFRHRVHNRNMTAL